MLDKSTLDALLVVNIIIYGLFFFLGLLWSWLLPDWHGRRKELLMQIDILACHDGVVTVTDLVLKARISPQRATKFLEWLTNELDIPPQVDDSGAIYYVFPKGSEIAQERRLAASNIRYRS